jgi:hypothetical protein
MLDHEYYTMIIPALINLISSDVDTVPLKTVNRQCSSGLQAVADVASAIKAGMYNIGMFYSSLILIFFFGFITDLILFSPFKRYRCWPRVHDSEPN